MELYAKRQKNEGYAYGPDTVWQREFEELFPFEETLDQQLAIEAALGILDLNVVLHDLVYLYLFNSPVDTTPQGPEPGVWLQICRRRN